MLNLFLKWLFACFLAANVLWLSSGHVCAQSHAGDSTLRILKYNLSNARNDTSTIKAQFALALFYVNKPDAYRQDIGTAIYYAKQAYENSRGLHYLTGERQGCVVLSQIYREEGDLKTGRMWAEKGLEMVRNGAAHKEIASACFEMANYFGFQDDLELEQKTKYFGRAVEEMRKYGKGSIDLANSLKFLADLHNMQGRGFEAIDELKQALVIYRNNHYNQLQDVYMLLGYIYNLVENTQESLRYSLLAVKTLEQYQDKSPTAVAAYHRLGMVYIGMNDPGRALPPLDKAYKLARRVKDYRALTPVAVNLSWVYLQRQMPDNAIVILKHALRMCPADMKVGQTEIISKLIEAYTLKKKYTTATSYYRLVQANAKDTSYSEVTATNLRFAALRLFIASGNFRDVSALLAAAEYTANKTKMIRLLATTEELKYKVDLANGNYREALIHHESFKRYSDSLMRRNYSKQLSAMELEYKTAQKDADLNQKSNHIRLLTKQSQLQESNLRNQQIIRNVYILAVGLLVLALMAVLSRYNLQKQSKLNLEAKQVEINQQNQSLRELVTEREWLLKEIHHRVKNNLQIVISLLNSQSVFLDNPQTVGILKESQNRIFSISLIHQKLYQEQTLSGVYIRSYIKELTSYLSTSFANKGHVTFEMNAEELLLDVADAVPLGLIMNEAITNSMKYAFPDKMDGCIKISIRQQQGNVLFFVIADNGIGLSSDFRIEGCNTLGLTLIRGLSDQLGAEFEMDGSAGVRYSLKWCRNKVQYRNRVKSG